ncbi:MAG: NADP-dependent oxidoreductase [Microbacteriaceae bacterium]
MKAFALSSFDTAPVAVDLDTPVPSAGEVRVKVHAASLNGFDVAVANGRFRDALEHRFPVVLGKDFAGTVDALGAGVEGYAVGDRVFGVVSKPYLGDGSFAEFVTVNASVGLARMPESMSFTEASALGLAGTAALDAFDAARIASGAVVLVVGATGGVGNQALQLAAWVGASVIATAHSAEEREQVTSLGAVELVDYTEDLVPQVLKMHPAGIDVVMHFAGPMPGLENLLKPGGILVSTTVFSPHEINLTGITFVPINAVALPGTLVAVADNDQRRITSLKIEEVYPLAKASEAIGHFERGTLGKLVISMMS